jgi:hypothetical protein
MLVVIRAITRHGRVTVAVGQTGQAVAKGRHPAQRPGRMAGYRRAGRIGGGLATRGLGGRNTDRATR